MPPVSPVVSLVSRLRNRHLLIIDILIFLLTPTLALYLREDDLVLRYLPELLPITALFLFVKLAVFYFGNLYSHYWRYASVDELLTITRLSLLSLILQTFALLALQALALFDPTFPRSVPIVDGLITLLAVGGVRFSVRLIDRRRSRPSSKQAAQGAILVGAGWGGVMIAREMQANPQLGLRPVAFLDDDPAKRNVVIGGIPVMGKCSDLAAVARETGVHQVVITMPTAPGKKIREIVAICEYEGLRVKTMPGMYELLGGTVNVKQLRDVDIEDLLRREPVRTDLASVGNLIRGRRVLVTGGGGSIGSELCRQALRFGPSDLVILGHGENSVFDIHNELQRLLATGLHTIDETGENTPELVETRIHTVIADVRFAERLESVFAEYKPEIVFHSAAHKHVPLMEANPSEAITNNVLGTHNLLRASQAWGVEHFVLISTDKAVNPTSVMGASKRVSELLVHQAAEQSGKRYVAVRFGNVLGSRGSVVNTFKQQIAAGGPVTITHPDMVRYFMTIPEAVQLVLQASVLGKGGEVFMLDMGEPMKVLDLAHDLIELSGLEVGRDIQIKYTGIRPGEKLYEEMFLHWEKYERTQHAKVYIAANAGGSAPHVKDLEESLRALYDAAEVNDNRAIVMGLLELVPEYSPARPGFLDKVKQLDPSPRPQPTPPGTGKSPEKAAGGHDPEHTHPHANPQVGAEIN